MNFKVDENLPVETADLLKAAGHDAVTVEDEGLSGTEDSVLIARIQDEARAFVTLDLDSSDIRAYPPRDFHGIIVG